MLRLVRQRVGIRKEIACDERQQNDIISCKVGIPWTVSKCIQKSEVHFLCIISVGRVKKKMHLEIIKLRTLRSVPLFYNALALLYY